MRLRKEVQQLIKEIKDNLTIRYGHERVLELVTKENRRLREENRRLVIQNDRLLDRLMARDFDQYAISKEPGVSVEDLGSYTLSEEYDPTTDEGNIGGVIENA